MKPFVHTRLMRCLLPFLWRTMVVFSACSWALAQENSLNIVSDMAKNPPTESNIISTNETISAEKTAIEQPTDTPSASETAKNSTSSSTKNSTNIQQQVQQLLQQQPPFQPLSFEDLEDYDVGQVDEKMLNEIYQVAELAKKDAETWQKQETRTSKTQPKNGENIIDMAQKTASITPDMTPVDVNQLMQNIQQDSQIIVENVQATEQQLDDIIQKNENDAPVKSQQSRWQRWKEQRALSAGLAKKIKYIDVNVTGTSDKTLKDNLETSLGNITQEAFQDYQALLPQLRKIASQASQAVGYYDAEFQFKQLSPQRLVVNVVAKDAVKVKSQSIEFTGAGEYLPQFQIVNVVPDLDENDTFNHGLYTQTKDRIEQAGTNNGFFDAYWRMHDVKVSLPENTADILLKYETGERYQLGDVEFRMTNGQPLPVNESVLQHLVPWKKGDDYTAWRATLLSNHLTNTRYFNNLNVNVIIPEPKEKRIELPPDVQALLEKQGLLTELSAENSTANSTNTNQNHQELSEFGFAGVNTEQNSDTSKTSQSNPENSTISNTLDESQQEIRKLQQQARETKIIPVIVTLNADKKNNMEIGLGYGSDTGVRLRTQYRRAIVNRFGHHLLANMEVSKIRQAVDFRYNIPYPHPINQYIALLAGYERESDFSVGQGMSLVSESAVAGAEYLLKSNRFDAWQHALGLRYRLDRLHVNGNVAVEDIPQEFVVVRGSDTQQSLLLSYKLSKIDADSPINPVQGFKQHYKIEVGNKSLLSDVDMAILTAGLSFIFSIGDNNNHQFIGRADGSYMFTNNFNQVPYNLRFFAGGDQSLRGFDYKSLSPTINGLKIGGQALAVGSLEYNYQFKEGWRLGIFSDFGNSFNKNFSNPLAYSVGLGLRWKSPVGPIRFDIASGLSDDTHPIRLHFFIGSPL